MPAAPRTCCRSRSDRVLTGPLRPSLSGTRSGGPCSITLLLSTYHWKPLVNGYSDHAPADFRQMVEPLSSFPTLESFAILRSRRTRYVVFHLDMYDQVLRRRLLERLETYKAHLEPLSGVGEVWLFEIVSWP